MPGWNADNDDLAELNRICAGAQLENSLAYAGKIEAI